MSQLARQVAAHQQRVASGRDVLDACQLTGGVIHEPGHDLYSVLRSSAISQAHVWPTTVNPSDRYR